MKQIVVTKSRNLLNKFKFRKRFEKMVNSYSFFFHSHTFFPNELSYTFQKPGQKTITVNVVNDVTNSSKTDSLLINILSGTTTEDYEIVSDLFGVGEFESIETGQSTFYFIEPIPQADLKISWYVNGTLIPNENLDRIGVKVTELGHFLQLFDFF